jgi:hypothetical protein
MPRQLTEREILELKQTQESSLMAIDKVTGVGVGPGADGELCIKVYVSELTPGWRDRIPTQINGVKVEIEVIGSTEIF